MTELFVYGSGECDQFGLGEVAFLQSKGPKKLEKLTNQLSIKIFKIACGGMHTLVLSSMGKVYSWGCNDDGALGREGPENEPMEVATLTGPMTDIAAGDSHSVAYNSELNDLFYWGQYRNPVKGNLGEPNKLPVQLPEHKLGSRKIKKIVCGSNHTLVLAGGSLYSWGDYEYGQIGRQLNQPEHETRKKAKEKEKVVKDVITVEKFATKNVLDVFSGKCHSFLIAKKTGGKKVLKAWGKNINGQLGLGHTEFTWFPTEVKFFNKDPSVEVVSVVGGENHSLALLSNNEVYAWGKNDEGQLGFEEKSLTEEQVKLQETVEEKPESTVMVPVKVNVDNISDIFSSHNFCYSLSRRDNKVYTWGFGESYVLGNKDDEGCSTPFEIPGEFWKNRKIDQIGLGAQHVVVTLFKEECGEADKPILEFESIEYKKGTKRKSKDTEAVTQSSSKRGKKGKENLNTQNTNDEAVHVGNGESLAAEVTAEAQKIIAEDVTPSNRKKSTDSTKQNQATETKVEGKQSTSKARNESKTKASNGKAKKQNENKKKKATKV